MSSTPESPNAFGNSLLTPEEVVEWLKIPKSWLYQRIHARNLPFPYLKVGRYVRFREADVRSFLEKGGSR